MNDGPVEPPRTIRRHLHPTHTIEATYNGRCVNCDESIRVGDTIGIVDDVGWCCWRCIDV
jgi:hypothetical protein